MSSSAIGPGGKIYCNHREEAAKRTSYTARHPNRVFYCCKRAQADRTRCNFWFWADDLFSKDTAIHAPQPSGQGTGTGMYSTSTTPRILRLLPERCSPSSNSSVSSPRGRRRLEDIEAGLKQREQDFSPTCHAGPSREGLLTSFASAQATPQPPSPVPTEVDGEVEAPPQKTYSFLGLHYNPESAAPIIKVEGYPPSPEKQRPVLLTEGTLPLTPPQTTRRIIRSGEPQSVSAMIHSRKGKEREGTPPVQTQHQGGCAQRDPSETGSIEEPQEDYLPLFTLAEDTSTMSSASPTTAENVLDYTDGLKARVMALSEYMDSFDITQAARLLQTIERQKNRYEIRDQSQRTRIEELVVEKNELAAELARLREALQR